MENMMREIKNEQMNRDVYGIDEVVVGGIVLKQWKRFLGRYNMLCISKDKTYRRVQIWVDPYLWDLQEHEAKWPEHVVLEGHWERKRRRFVATRILECREVEFYV